MGTRGSEVPLVRCSRRRHPTRTHLPQSRGAGEPTPAASPRDLPRTLKRLGVPHQVKSMELTADGWESVDGHRREWRRS